jgi:hypothetical protein
MEFLLTLMENPLSSNSALIISTSVVLSNCFEKLSGRQAESQ